ncbi:hypothetical protein HAX54_019329 [Datura stramonium]|uniref:Pentatricopeptide repeat-containing protein n=1 Tax=Datura stramonium TaxID=4076 RepID=A0ABS8UR07_DATST|nr:hypothetical protein [Datura stramonium]
MFKTESLASFRSLCSQIDSSADDPQSSFPSRHRQKIGRVDVALRVLKETQVPNFLTYSIAICNLCKLNDLVNLQNVLKIMLGKSYYPNDETLFVILSCYCKVGWVVEAKQILGLMIVLGVPMSEKVWGMLIDGYSKAGNMDVASHLFEKMV